MEFIIEAVLVMYIVYAVLGAPLVSPERRR